MSKNIKKIHYQVTNSNFNHSIKYESYIDGLRAIAVLSVIFFHAKFAFKGQEFFSGGFVGVDIFFVISGYLISSIIFREHKKNIFSFKGFYERRARRILPALLTVLIMSSIIGWLYLLPKDLIDYSNTVFSAIFYYSNYLFYNFEIEYFATSSLQIPHLHLWSLAVEEQFYIIFPIIFILISKFSKDHILILLFFAFLFSLQFSEILSEFNNRLNFYSLHTRGWELIAGIIIAKIVTDHGRIDNKILNNILPLLGLILIFLIFFKETDKLPSYKMLIPIIGTVLIIYFSDEKSLITKILSLRILLFFGLLSYSLYLWHHPLFAFGRIILQDELNLNSKIFIIILSILLSYLTFVFIEQPFRNKKLMKFKNFSWNLCILLLIPIIFASFVIYNNGYKKRMPLILQKNFSNENPWNISTDEKNNKCYDRVEMHCSFNHDSKNKVYLIGDSVLAAYQENLKSKLIDQNYSLTIMTNPSCLYLPNYEWIDVFSNKPTKSCNYKVQDERKKTLLKSKNSIVIIGGMMPLYLTEKFYDNKEGGQTKIFQSQLALEGSTNFFRKKNITNNTQKNRSMSIKKDFKKEVLFLANKGHKIILQYPVPEVGWHVRKKMLSHLKKPLIFIKEEDIKNNKITTSYLEYLNRTNTTYELYDSIIHDNIFRVYPSKIFCDNSVKERCITHTEHEILYWDEVHTFGFGSDLIVDQIMKKIDLIMKID